MKLFLVSGPSGRSLQAADRHIKTGSALFQMTSAGTSRQTDSHMFLHWGGPSTPDLLTHAPVSLVVGLIDLISLGGGYET